MNIRYNPLATKAFADAPPNVQKASLKQAGFLLHNLRHPSLRKTVYI